MEILILISIIIVIALIAFSIVASQQDKARKKNIASHPALGSFTFHYGTSLNTSIGLDLTNKKICFVTTDYEPKIYNFSQIKSIKSVERSIIKDYRKPRTIDYDNTIANSYDRNYFGVDLDIEISAPEKIIYSIAFLKTRTSYGELLYKAADRERQKWRSMIEEHIGKRGDIEITGTITGNIPVTSVADEIQKLKNLLDAGVLTTDEFDRQKAKLLNS
ncbi:SHOCT domain-containing protein [Emticicia fluvialis]|uniref:SHOCT domain-containing protein n=1 Tax=Emticicia fluvialis TaxID=2974474 RepID=UPI002166166C|nr:SHOCT domain-containing protein [Emticicia fluvialis]